MGASALWLKEEIKDVLSEKEEKMIADVKKQVNKALADKRTKRKTFLLP